MNKKLNNMVIIIFLFTLLFRLYFAFQSPYFSDDDAYFNARQVESIVENGKPIFEDELSFSGKNLFSPLFHYLIAAFVYVFGNVALKVVPALLMSSLVLIVFMITKEITNDKNAILFSTFIAGFIPIMITTTLNNLTIYSLALPLTFLTLLAFIKINKKGYLTLFAILSILLPLVHPIAFLVLILFLLYFLICKSEDMKVGRLEKEAIFFFVFTTLLVEFFIYKEAFLKSGFGIIFQNIPTGLLDAYFLNINLTDILISLGIIPLLFALVGIFFGIFKQRNSSVVLFSSVMLSTMLLLLVKLINFNIGILLLAISATILSSIGFEKFFKYVEITKIHKLKPYIIFLLLVLVVLTLVFPSLINASNVLNQGINDNEFLALEWIKENTEKDSVILSSAEEGNYISAISNRKNVIDKNFLLAENIDERYNDIQEFFKTTSITKAANIMRKYNADYVYISKKTKKIYTRENFNYLEDKACFRKSYDLDGAEVYKLRC